MRYPDLSKSKIISFDIETYDPELTKKGSGAPAKNGRILGVAIADENGFSEYYNIGHKLLSLEEKTKNLNYIQDVLALHNDKLAANALYDLDWLINAYDFKVNGNWYDIQIAEPLLDEYRDSYSLDSLAKDYLGKEKFKTEIEEFCEQNKLKGDPRQHLYLMPVEMVAKYAVQDVLLPVEIFKLQWEKMKEQNLLDLFKMEMRLFPLLLRMRKTGVRIDISLLEKTKNDTKQNIENLKHKLALNYGNFNHNSAKQIAQIFDKLKLPYPLTEKGNPNLDKKVLGKCGHEIARRILEIRHQEKLYSTFLINSFTDHRVNDRIHCSFFPMKTDEYGTKSGRFSSANPNLQQIPGDKEDPLCYICRELFIPEEGHYWGKIDYSQIEYRLIAHYASGLKSDEIRDQYNSDPNTDYHQLIMDWTGVSRKDAKRLNFGMAYAMGVARCSEMFGWSMEESSELITRYHEQVPFVRYTRNQVVNVAKGRKYILTILNRRARLSQDMMDRRKEFTMFNRLIQGSAADMMKKAMVDCWDAGLFDVLSPHITVHDEMDVSVPKSKIGVEAFSEMKKIMENAIKLRVPVIADAEIGDNWANCSEEKFLKTRMVHGL